MIGLALLLCWSVSFIFAGIEAGLLSIDPVRLRHNAKQGDPAALELSRLLRQPERLLVTVLLVTNFADILALLLIAAQLARIFGTAGYVITFLCALPIHLFLLGVLPKSLFRRFPYRALAGLAGLLKFTSNLLWPLLELGRLAGRLVLPRTPQARPRIFAAREELKYIASQSEREGAITSTERAMIHNVVDFRNVQVGDMMLPAPEIVTVNSDTPVAEVLELSARRNIDRVPVMAPDGRVTGLVNVLDILLDQTPPRPLAHYLRRIVTTRLDEPAHRLIRRLRAARLSLAAVLDENGALTGIVTAEDLIKRLVTPHERPLISPARA